LQKETGGATMKVLRDKQNNMENEVTFKCDDCEEEWSSLDYDEDSETEEGYFGQGLKCPNCKGSNIGQK
jgi:Zn finger protein HypA/HybF involved in hydrogenase expression